MRRSACLVWFFVVPGSELLDVAGPWEVLAYANQMLGRTAYELELVSLEGSTSRTRHGVLLGAVRRLPQRPARFPDVGIVAGGSPFEPLPPAETRLARFLERHQRRIPTLVSICTGAFVFGAAGLLDGRRATTHWRFLGALKARFPKAAVVDDGIFVRAGKLWTSAGVTAGIDLALSLVERDHGRAIATQVARELVLFLRRSGNQAQFSEALRRQATEPPKLRDISSFVLCHLGEELSVERMARGLGMSPRSLSRWCRAELDESPAELVRRLRLDEARRMLEDTALPLKEIAARTGLGDPSTLFRLFTHRLGVTPAAYRARFAA